MLSSLNKEAEKELWGEMKGVKIGDSGVYGCGWGESGRV